MQTYEIYPICTGIFSAAEKSNFTYQKDHGVKIRAPILMYLVKGKDKIILADTGCSDEAWAAKYHHPITRTEDQDPLNALAKLGVSPDDVDIIVNTHLHWDHCFNNELFPKAKIFVQEKELKFAACPIATQYPYYEPLQTGMVPKWIECAKRMKTVDGDYKLCDGIDLVFLPGHTEGFQGILVNTDAGECLIASDSLPLYENWPGNGAGFHATGIHSNLLSLFASYQRIEQLNVKFFPGHEIEVLSIKKFPE